jgi:hypothetical protein
MNKRFRTSAWLITFFCLFGLAMSACEDDDDDLPSNEVRFQNIALTGANERPAVTTNNSGTFNGIYNKDTKVISYTVTWTGFTATAMHFHKADPTIAGPVVIPVAGTGTPATYTAPITGNTRPLTEAEEADLLNGLWYFNIHSAQYPGGEIRGQLVK